MRTAAVVLLVVVASCGTKKSVEEAWATADYAKAGVPALDHPWTAAEVTTAVDVVAREAAEHPERLPRFGGAKSGPVFAQLVAATPPDPADSTVATNLEQHLMRYEALNRASKLYVTDMMAPISREGIELYGGLLREAARLRPLFEPFLATIPADDPSMPARKQGLAKFEAGMTSLTIGSIRIAGDSRTTEADRLAMLRLLVPTVNDLFAKLSAEQRERIRSQLSQLVEASSGAVHDEAASLLSAMKRF